jgi:hypothetical protein
VPTLRVGQVSAQGFDLIIVQVDPSFADLDHDEQISRVAEIKAHADAAGLSGDVVPIWERDPHPHIGFLADLKYHAFFRDKTIYWVWTQVGLQRRDISW